MKRSTPMYLALILAILTVKAHAAQPLHDTDGIGPQLPVDPLISLLLTGNLPVISDGGGKLTLTASMVTSGADPQHINIYQNYLIRAQLNLSNVSNISITNCDIGNIAGGADGIFLNTVTNVSVTYCTFHDINNGTGIAAFPTNIIGCHFDNNTFTNVWEAIHLDFGKSGQSGNVTVNSNYITGYSRIGIELQWVVNGLQVNHNYITNRLNDGNNGGLMAISCATGSQAGMTVDTHNVEVAFNTLIGPAWANAQIYAAIENMGSGNNVHNNVLYDWGNGIIWGNTTFSGQVAWHFTNNTLVGVTNNPGYDEGFGNSNAPTVAGTKVFALTAANAPAIPTIAQTTVSGTASTQPSGTTTGTSQPSVGIPGFTAISTVSGNVTLTWTMPLPVVGSLSIISTVGGAQSPSLTIPAGATSAQITNVHPGWAENFQLSSQSLNSAVATVTVAGDFTLPYVPGPTLVVPVVVPPPTPPPVTQPAPVTIGYSRDGGKTWTTGVTVQP